VDELRDAEAVRAHYGEPSHMSKAKQLDHLDAHCKAFIKLSPFVVMATTDAAGRADASPRGDRPGQVATGEPTPSTTLPRTPMSVCFSWCRASMKPCA
jgi:predicted pyridoxine 5'-phosphate oxidase superfamily flavin-nucleotide-binding protein